MTDSNTTNGTDPLGNHYGDDTLAMVAGLYDEGVERAVLLMRHSARTFDRSIHDLENHLTDHGRSLCEKFGRALPPHLTVTGYASPAERCLETGRIIIDTHRSRGGEGGRTRPVEALGVFYALDQRKMWRGLSAAGGLADYVRGWYEGAVPEDAMMPTGVAVNLLMNVLLAKLDACTANGLVLCVSHDMTLFTVRHGMGLEPVHGPDVEFLDGLVVYERAGRRYLRSQHGGEVDVANALATLTAS